MTDPNLGPGEVIGRLGFINSDHVRTQSLECIEAGELLRIGYEQLRQLYFQDPSSVSICCD